MTIIIIILAVFLILITAVVACLIHNIDIQYKTRTKQTIDDVLNQYSFEKDSMLIVSNKLIIALNNQFSRIAVIENYKPDIPDMYNYYEIRAGAILNIEKSQFLIKINYAQDGEIKSLTVPSYSKEGREFCHGLMAKVLFKKLEAKLPDYKFSYFATSDWECSYIWAYDSIKCAFAYLLSGDLNEYRVINLRKELVSIDTLYNYVELAVMGGMKQLNIYEKNFVNKLFSNLYESVRTHITPAVADKIFYDDYSEILYLSNGNSTFQTVILNRIDDVFYRENRIQFTLNDSPYVINFSADKKMIEDMEKFVVGYNLRQIANSFDYKTDKLVNVNTNTKFIIDITRDRVVYCANLNKFRSFSYMTIAFYNIESTEVINNATRCYVRIKTKDGEILDVTCLKTEVAYYVKAQIDSIILED